jgi:hypothetical protein
VKKGNITTQKEEEFKFSSSKKYKTFLGLKSNLAFFISLIPPKKAPE